MRLAWIFLFCAFSMLVSANSVRLDDCGAAYCKVTPLTNFTQQGVLDWEQTPQLGAATNRYAEDVIAWSAQFLPKPEQTSIAKKIEEPKAAKKAPVVHGDASLASYVRAMRGLHTYEYTPVEIPQVTITPE
ncbi:MAG: hypothetical protein FJW32_08940 [Acidobacteria bacterium]|nr:hypothetical protein [Acidobacteriota bacterium]